MTDCQPEIGDAPLADLAARLGAVDWSFHSRSARDRLEALHPYPAKFIPEIPGTLLDLLPVPAGTGVLDPFVGSGTTLVESQRRGLSCTGIDVNPIACLISRVKTSPLPPGLILSADAVLASAGRRTEAPVAIPNVDHWFRRDVQLALGQLRDGIVEAPPAHQDALRLALSSIVVRVSNQESDTRYAAVDKAVRGRDVPVLFRAACERVEAGLRGRTWEPTGARVLQMDAQRVGGELEGCPVGAVVTSPPYPNAYEYWLYHKYRMYWLSYDPIAVKASEIGARPHFFKKNPHTPRHFFEQMVAVFVGVLRVLVPGGWVCVVVGRSRISGEIVDNAAIIREVAERLGLTQAAELERRIRLSRKSFNLAHSRLKTESILVFRRP